jgi:hypothetical protein
MRSYWNRQWTIIDPLVEPVEISLKGKGEAVVNVHQVVRDPKGTVLTDRLVIHVFRMRNGVSQRFDIRDV